MNSRQKSNNADDLSAGHPLVFNLFSFRVWLQNIVRRGICILERFFVGKFSRQRRVAYYWHTVLTHCKVYKEKVFVAIHLFFVFLKNQQPRTFCKDADLQFVILWASYATWIQLFKTVLCIFFISLLSIKRQLFQSKLEITS